MKPILAAFALLAAVHGGVFFEEKFDRKLDSGWSWVRENPQTWRAHGGVLEIRIEPGNMWGPENSGRNVLVRELPQTNAPIEISMTVENQPTEQYEQVDLVSYFDDSNMVKIGQELVDGKLSIVMGREENDRARTIAIIPLEKFKVELKQVIENGNVTGKFRPDGEKEWRTAGTCDLPRKTQPRAAIQCYQGSKDKEHWAKISSFRITSGSADTTR